VSVFQQNASGGLRYSSSVGYLDHHSLPNLTVLTRTRITRIVIANGRASGVEVLTEQGRGTITAGREVIMCAGVYGSPQLLMLSGVGPAGHLREHGIDVAADLPVGDNLHDHMFVPMTYCMTSARNRGTTPYFVSGVVKELSAATPGWAERSSKPLVSSAARRPGTYRTSRYTRCRGRTRSPTRTRRPGRRWTSAAR
jgi:choline dehydrogenase